MIPAEHLRKSWILEIDDDEPITARGAQENLTFVRSQIRLKYTIHLHNHKALNGTLLNYYGSTFDQFEKSRPVMI